MKLNYFLPLFICVIGCTVTSNSPSNPATHGLDTNSTLATQVSLGTTSELTSSININTPVSTSIDASQRINPTATLTPQYPSLYDTPVPNKPTPRPDFIPICRLPINKALWRPLLNKSYNELGALDYGRGSIVVMPNEDVWAVVFNCAENEKSLIKINVKAQTVKSYVKLKSQNPTRYDRILLDYRALLHVAQDKTLWLINLFEAPVLSYYDPSKDIFISIDNPILDAEAERRSFDNFEEDLQGRFWFEGVTENSNTVLRYNYKTKHTEVFEIKHPIDKRPFSYRRFKVAQDNFIWLVGNYGQDKDTRVIKFNTKTGTIEDFGPQPTTIGMGFFLMGIDGENNLWFGDSGFKGKTQFFKLNNKTKQWLNLGNTAMFEPGTEVDIGILVGAPTYIHHLRNNEMWTKARSGLVRYNSANQSWELIGPGLRDFYEDDKGCIWSVGQGQVWKYCPSK